MLLVIGVFQMFPGPGTKMEDAAPGMAKKP
jgi:hypothetical protein